MQTINAKRVPKHSFCTKSVNFSTSDGLKCRSIDLCDRVSKVENDNQTFVRVVGLFAYAINTFSKSLFRTFVGIGTSVFEDDALLICCFLHLLVDNRQTIL